MNNPIFTCAHRCNKTKWVDDAVNKNFNAIETDIWKDEDGKIWARHDKYAPRTDIDEFLNYLKQSIFGTSKGDNIVMWVWDLKDTMTTDDIKSLRTKINNVLPSNVYKFYCVTDDNRSKLESIVSDFGNYEGINYDADYWGKNTQIEDVLSWKDDNNVKNLIYSCGIDPLPGALPDALSDDDKIIKSLTKAVQLRNSGKNFGIYTWTFDSLDNSKKWLESLLLNGIMGNTNKDFGSLPNNLPENLRLATRSDGVNAWRYAETNPNLNIVGLAFEMNNWYSTGTWKKHQNIGNQDGDEKWVADGYCWNSDINDSGYGKSLIYLGDAGPFYSIVGGYTTNDKDGTIEQWGKQEGDEDFVLSHGYRDSWYYVYHHVYLVKNDIVDNVSGFEVTSDGSYIYDVGASTSDKQEWGHLNAWDSTDKKGNHYFYAYLENEMKVDSQGLEDQTQQLQAQIEVPPKD